MQPTPRSRLLAGLGAAAGACAVTAMLAAPAARADDITDIFNAIHDEFGDAHSAFVSAATDFGSGDVTGGLASFFNGVNDDFLSVPNSFLVGGLEAIGGQPFDAGTNWVLTAPSDFATALSNAQSDFTLGESYFAAAPGYLEAGESWYALSLDFSGFNDTLVVPAEQLLMGGFDALGFA